MKTKPSDIDCIFAGFLSGCVYLFLTVCFTAISCGAEPSVVSFDEKDAIPLVGHQAVILSVAMSPDGRTAATGSHDREIILWNTATGKEKLRIRTKSVPISLAFGPKGRTIAAGTRDKSAVLWDAESGKEIMEFPNHKGGISALALTPNGTQLIVGVETGQGGVWDANQGKPLRPLDDHSKSISSIAISPDGLRVALASQDKTVSVWDLVKGKRQTVFQEHQGAVETVAFDSRGNRIVSGSADRTAVVWDSRTGKEILQLKGHSAPVVFADFAPDGLSVYTGSSDKMFIQWNLRTGEPMVRCRLDFPISHVAMSADAFHTIACGIDSKARVFRTDSLQFVEPRKPAPPEDKGPFAKLPKEQPVLRLNPNLKPGETERNQTPPPTSPKENLAIFHPNGPFVYSVGSDASGIVWDLERKDAVYLISSSQPLTSSAFRPNGTIFVAGTRDGQILLLHPKSGMTLQTLKGHTGAVNGIAFSSDGNRMLSASSDRTLVFWNMETERSLGAFLGHTDQVRAVAILPDNSKAISVSLDKTVRIWEPTGKLFQTLEEPKSDWISLAVAPNGSWFATGSNDKTVVLWDAREYKPIKTLSGFPEPPIALAFNPASSILATGGADGLAVFWNTKTWEPFRSFPQISRADEEKRIAEIKERQTRKKWSKGTPQATRYEPIRFLAFNKTGSQWISSGGCETFLWNVVDPESTEKTAAENPKGAEGSESDSIGKSRADDPIALLPLGEPIRRIEGFQNPVLDASLSRDYSKLLVAEAGKQLILFNALNGEEVSRITTRVPMNKIALSPDGRTVFGGGEDGRFFSINLTTGKDNFAQKVHTDQITSLAINQTGSRAITGGDDRIAVAWDLPKGENLGRFSERKFKVRSVAINKNGSKALTGFADNTMVLWDTKTLESNKIWQDHRGPVLGVAFSPDGFQCVSASGDRTAIVYLAATGKELVKLTGSRESLCAVTFSPDGSRILTGGEEGNTVLWDAKSGQPLRRFPGRYKPLLDVAFSSDGKLILVVDPRGVSLWKGE